ncbi:MAG TPA: IS200/IS605 family transposase [Marinilabiliaceae bacterium]|nr:IS200/IS605 family transposase [Marinilabiliaceae bacterium]
MQIDYHNLYIHFILITKDRYPFIKEENRNRIEKYITGIVANTGSKLYAIYANPEHIHFLVSKNPKISEEELVTRVSESSKQFIIKNKLALGNFKWQESGSAFSVSKAEVDKVCKYILNQPEHHKKTSFKEEYEGFIKFYQQTLKWGN